MRRGFGRPLRRMLGPDVPPLLRRANQMLSAGNYAEAASAFEQLARAAEARGGPRAPLFYVQAGRSRIMAGQTANGLEYVERGLGLFALRGQPFKVANMGRRIIAELNARGLKKEAQHVTDYVKELVPGAETASADAAPAKRPPLPTHCPGCGAPLRPDEVDWMDDATAACAYCGSPVRGEG
jgi:hypothetical protein